jgi:hypothetical protein
MNLPFVFAALLFVLPAHAEVTFDWVTVGDPGNAGDTEVMTCCGDSIGTSGYGSVGYVYKISEHEVTNAQYAEFLNAVAAADTYALYNGSMSSGHGGITRSGSWGSYTYSARDGRENRPVNYVSWYDTLRFANWLHNGQPTGAQDNTTTEDGAYDMSLGDSVVREAGAQAFLTSEDEWYKAAYYAGVGTYYDYPAGSDTETTCAAPGATANTANCLYVVSDLTDAGSYTSSASPNGTFDQGGNVWEWNEAITVGVSRSLRGAGFYETPENLAASVRSSAYPTYENSRVGFRVASPGSALPLPSVSPVGVALLGGAVFGIGIMGLVIAARRRLN